MISAVKGRLFSLKPGEAHLETGNGVIYEIRIPVSNFSGLKDRDEVLLHTVLRVKDEVMVLYGFLTLREKLFFEKLISVSGVGGKTALSLISAFSSDELVKAINDGDTGKISSIPGIGKKTAQRVILELTGKLELEETPMPEAVQLRDDLISGLVNLGYPAKSVKELVQAYLKENPEAASFGDSFKQLLKKISKL
ncbi:MAG: Holliday junction branch migration protein RuvA [Candidatus Omnitrophota bacterium]